RTYEKHRQAFGKERETVWRENEDGALYRGDLGNPALAATACALSLFSPPLHHCAPTHPSAALASRRDFLCASAAVESIEASVAYALPSFPLCSSAAGLQMSSHKFLLPPVHGKIRGQAPQSYPCSEKYEWQNLSTTVHQSEQAAGEEPDDAATLHCPLHMPGSVGEYTASHGHGHSAEIRGPGNEVGGPCYLSCSFGGCHGKDHACLSHSSKRARRGISPGPGLVRSYQSKKRPSFDNVHHCAKGADRQICQAGSCRKSFSGNQWSSSQNYHDDRYLPTKRDFLDGHFSEVDAARHRSYMCNFQSCSKHNSQSGKDPTSKIPVHTSHGRFCQRNKLERASPNRLVNEFRPIHHEQLEISPNEDIHECLDSSRNFRNCYKGKIAKRKCIKQGFLGKTYNGACASKYERNNSRKRNADHLGGKKAWTNMANKDKSKRLCCPIEQDQQQEVESDKTRNYSREGNTKVTKFVGQNGPKGNPMKNATCPASSGSTKCDENSNMLSAKCSKTIASSNTPKLSEGSNDMDLEYDVDGFTERGIQQLPDTHRKKSMQLKEPDTVSLSEALRRDCLILWRARQLRKDRAAKADKIVNADQQLSAQRSKVPTGRRGGNGKSAASSCPESDNEDDSASECSDQATSYDRLQKCGEGRVNKKSEWPIKSPSNSKRNKNPQNVTAQKGVKCSLWLPPEANPLEIAHPKEKENPLDRWQLPIDDPDAKVHISLNGGSDTGKVDQEAVSHYNNSAHQNISQKETGRHAKLAVKCETKAGGHGGKWAEHSAGFTGSTLLDEETVACCSMQGKLKVNALESPNHERGSTPFDGPILAGGSANMYPKEPINRSSESYGRDFKNWSDGNDCSSSEQEGMHHNLLRKEQEALLLTENENELNEKATQEGCQPQARMIEITSNRLITEDCTSDIVHSGAAKQGDRIPRSIPDLNCSPSMTSDEDFVAPPEEPVCQVSADSFKPQRAAKSLSASLTGPIVKEEEFKQVKEEQRKQAEANHINGEVCKKESTSELERQLQISESNTGPPQQTAVEESSASMEAFKCALCEFVKKIVKPLWENGLLSREVHKIVVKKTVEKVAGVWASSAPLTEIVISRILSDEAKNIEKLVKDYLAMYVGREVLKRINPGNP
ncbi:hypothetical protein U9M48_009805, partial [Paspalum notatum var. saurae]